MDAFTFEADGFTFECCAESHGLRWHHATLEAPFKWQESTRWYFRVNGGLKQPGPPTTLAKSPAEVRGIVTALFFGREPR